MFRFFSKGEEQQEIKEDSVKEIIKSNFQHTVRKINFKVRVPRKEFDAEVESQVAKIPFLSQIC